MTFCLCFFFEQRAVAVEDAVLSVLGGDEADVVDAGMAALSPWEAGCAEGSGEVAEGAGAESRHDGRMVMGND